MKSLANYYQELYNFVCNDMDMLLADPDITKHNPKLIMSYLEIAKTCDDQLKALSSSNDDWNQLSPAALTAIDSIIKKDLNR